MTGELLPLFPLRAVLFPGSALPLHIFEERYRVLVAESIRDDREFGIIMAEGDALRPIGCTASITRVMRRYDDGRMDIVVSGRRRFELTAIADPKAPYIVGQVRYLDPPGEEEDPWLRARAVGLYNEFVGRAYKDDVGPIDLASAGPDVSFRIAQKAGMDLADRQRLLEMPLEADRLRAVIKHLERVIPLLDTIESIDRLVQNDGYL
jgi:ATP-dependent Lon protease